MKKIILLLIFNFISFIGFTQNYPLKTFFKEDSVVIMTINQYEEINSLLKSQSQKSKKYKIITDSLQKSVIVKDKKIKKYNQINDSLIEINRQMSIQIDTLKKFSRKSEKWFLERAIDNAWIYFDWQDSTIKCLDLTLYGFQSKRNGEISFVKRPGVNLVSDIEYWKQENRINPEIPQLNWTDSYKDEKLILLKYPFKMIPSYKPKKIIIIKP